MRGLPVLSHVWRMFVVVLALGIAGACSAADKIPVAKRIPRDSLAYLRVPSVPVLKERFLASSFGKLFQDPASQPFIEEFQSYFTKTVASQFEANSGLTLEEASSLFTGELALAVLPMDEGEFYGVVFLEFGTQRELLDRWINKLVEAQKEKGATLTTDTVEGVEVSFLESPPAKSEDDEESDDEEAKPTTVSWFVQGEHFVLGAGKGWAGSILSRWDGADDRNLASQRTFQTILSACQTEGREPALEFYVDPIGLMKGILSSGEAVSPQIAVFLGFLPQLGLDKFQGLGGTYDLNVEGCNERIRMLFQYDQPPSRLMKLFQFPAKPLAPSAWIPATAATYGTISWDLAAAYAAIGETFDTFQGRGKFDEVVASSTKELGIEDFNLKTDVIDQFTGTIEWFTPLANDTDEVKDQITAEGAEAVEANRFAIGFELANADQFGKLLAKLSKTPVMASIKQRDFEGNTIYEVGADEEGGVVFAVVGNRLLVTMVPTIVEDALRKGDGDRLADSDDFRRYRGKLPDEVSMLGFERVGDTLGAIVTTLKTLSPKTGDDDENDLPDFTKLPDAEVIKKYVAATISSLKPHEQGLFYEMFSLETE